MQKLCTNVAEDIKRCANTCDTYLKLVRPHVIIFPFLTADQEEDTYQDLLWGRLGEATCGVRRGFHKQAERIHTCAIDSYRRRGW